MSLKVTPEAVAASMEALRPMLPMLTGYARAMTDDPAVVVEIGPKTQTDGKRIFIRPPLALAELGEHERTLCGQRGQYGVLACPTCAEREEILVKMRHEIGHIVHGSFRPLRANATALKAMATGVGLPSAAIARPPRWEAPLLEVASTSPNPYLPTLALALEDLRVDMTNSSHFMGGAEVHRASLARLVAEGVGPENTPLAEAQLAQQVLIGILCDPHGVDMAEFVTPEALAIIRDAEIVELTHGNRARAGSEIIERAYRLLRRLIDLKVLPDPEPPEEPEPEQGPEGGSEDSDTGEGGKGDGEQHGEQGAEPEEDDAGSGEDEQQEQDAGGGEDQEQEEQGDEEAQGRPEGDGDTGDGGDEELDDPAQAGDSEQAPDESDQGEGEPEADADALREVVQTLTGHDADLDGDFDVDERRVAEMVAELETQLEHFGDPRPHLGQVNVYGRRRALRGELFGRGRGRSAHPSEALLGSLVGRARTVFAANATVKRQRGATRGRVAPTVLGKRAWNPEDQRLFERRQRNDAPSYSVLVGMDDSGSTSGGISTMLRETALAIATMCQRVGVEVSLYAHTTGLGSLDIYEIKAPDQPWSPRIGDDLRALAIGNTNYDGSTMTAYRRILAERPATRKVLLYFTDGAIPGAGGQAEAQIMREEVVACRRQGVTLLGVGVRTSSPEQFGIPTVRLDEMSDTRKVLEFLAKEFGI